MRGILVLLVSLALVSCAGVYEGITVKKATRNIDLTSQFSKQNVTLSLTNSGSQSAAEVYFALDTKTAAHLSLFDAYIGDSEEPVVAKVAETVEREIAGKKVSFVLYRVALPKPLAPSATLDVRGYQVFTHTQTPYPASISQTEKQLVKYYDNAYIASPYVTQTQTTTIKLATSHIEHKTDVAPTSVKGDTITYGPYVDLQSFRHAELFLHFENNANFLTVTSLVKEFEISHWGNVAVEETYKVQHDGARLKGTFSRYDYQRSGGNAPAHIPVMRHVLPEGASDIYYRDEIGNISTSHITVSQKGLHLDLVPRFPLFGGWKFGFYMGYNLAAQNYLGTDQQNSKVYVLNVPFAAEFDNAAIDEITVRVILPEGATEIEVHTPFPIDGQSKDTHYTYLDTSGRPVVIVQKKNIISDHNRNFQVTYKFSQMSLFQEPFLLIVAFFLFFLFIMVYMRLEFNIGPTKARNPNQDKLDDILLRVKDLVEQRTEHHESLDEALSKAIKGKNAQSYTSDRQRIENLLSQIRKELSKLITEAEGVDGDATRKLREVEKKEDNKSRSQIQLHELEIAYRFKKTVTKTAYDSSKDEYEKALNSADEELEGLVSDLTSGL